MDELPAASLRVAEAARTLGLRIDIRVLREGTRTAEEAAAACGCDVAQIVKSLVFRRLDTGAAVLLLVSGSHRVDEAVAAAGVGAALERPNAAFVRQETGYAIGGIPPFGHAKALAAFMDRDLLRFATAWAAAGTPTTLFAVEPEALRRATAAAVIAMTGEG